MNKSEGADLVGDLDVGRKLGERIGIISARPPGVNLPALLLWLLLYCFYHHYSSQVQPRRQTFFFEFISVHLAHFPRAVVSKLFMFYSSVRFLDFNHPIVLLQKLIYIANE